MRLRDPKPIKSITETKESKAVSQSPSRLSNSTKKDAGTSPADSPQLEHKSLYGSSLFKETNRVLNAATPFEIAPISKLELSPTGTLTPGGLPGSQTPALKALVQKQVVFSNQSSHQTGNNNSPLKLKKPRKNAKTQLTHYKDGFGGGMRMTNQSNNSMTSSKADDPLIKKNIYNPDLLVAKLYPDQALSNANSNIANRDLYDTSWIEEVIDKPGHEENGSVLGITLEAGTQEMKEARAQAEMGYEQESSIGVSLKRMRVKEPQQAQQPFMVSTRKNSSMLSAYEDIERKKSMNQVNRFTSRLNKDSKEQAENFELMNSLIKGHIGNKSPVGKLNSMARIQKQSSHTRAGIFPLPQGFCENPFRPSFRNRTGLNLLEQSQPIKEKNDTQIIKAASLTSRSGSVCLPVLHSPRNMQVSQAKDYFASQKHCVVNKEEIGITKYKRPRRTSQDLSTIQPTYMHC